MMFRFLTANVSNAGPFADRQQLRIPEGVTIVAAAAGAGKTTITTSLRNQIRRLEERLTGNHYVNLPDWLIFLDDTQSLPYGGAPWPPLAALMSSMPELSSQRPTLERYVTYNVRHLLAGKLGAHPSKFSGIPSTEHTLYVHVTDDGTINISCCSHPIINDRFLAVGERLVLYLSLNDALRKVMDLDLPFVCDFSLGSLDSFLITRCLQFISNISHQILILENHGTLSFLGVAPTIEIMSSPLSGKSRLWKAT